MRPKCFPHNAKTSFSPFHCVNICIDGLKALMGKTAVILVEIKALATSYASSHFSPPCIHGCTQTHRFTQYLDEAQKTILLLYMFVIIFCMMKYVVHIKHYCCLLKYEVVLRERPLYWLN